MWRGEKSKFNFLGRLSSTKQLLGMKSGGKEEMNERKSSRERLETVYVDDVFGREEKKN